jgi:hypothetical protein
VAFHSRDPAGRPLLDEVMRNAVLVTTSILGPMLTQRYAPMMRGLGCVGGEAVPRVD